MRRGNGRGIKSNIPFLLIGGGIGAGLALIFAPKPGNELRHEIADATRKGYDVTWENVAHLQDHSANLIRAVKEKASEIYEIAAQKLHAADEKPQKRALANV